MKRHVTSMPSIFAVGTALFAIAAPAQAAISLDAANCVSVSDSAGCKFDGVNLANAGQASTVQSLYNNFLPAFPDAPISLANLLGTNPGTAFGTMTGAGTTSGTWSTPGFLIDYLAVSSSNTTILYKLGGVSSGNWSTVGIYNRNGVQQNLSHLAFFGTTAPVPEPATWAMMIVGMGVVGSTLRRRTARMAVSFS